MGISKEYLKEIIKEVIRESIENISYQISMESIRKIIIEEIKIEMNNWSFWERLKFFLGRKVK